MSETSIKLIVFDLDGVLVDSRPLHFHALNAALAEIGDRFVISEKDHFARFDGHSTTTKLKMLQQERGLKSELFDQIWKSKQAHTFELIKSQFSLDRRLCNVLKTLKSRGFLLYCATNAIFNSAKLMLMQTGAFEFIDYLVSNEDVSKTKPNPEIYMRCMIRASVSPKETLVLEDSPMGRKAAIDAGCHLMEIEVPEDVTLQNIEKQLSRLHKRLETSSTGSVTATMLVPMAGRGTSFQKCGSTFPKSLTDILGKPMVQIVCDNVKAAFGKQEFYFGVLQTQVERFNLHHVLQLIDKNAKVVSVEEHVRGCAFTLQALLHTVNDTTLPVFVVNSDQFCEWDIAHFVYCMDADTIDGGLVTFDCIHPKFSYVEKDENGFVKHVWEKQPMSNCAVAGIFYFKSFHRLAEVVDRVVSQNAIDQEVFFSDVINEFVKDGAAKLRCYHIDRVHSFATPEDVQAFLSVNNSVSDKLKR